MSNKAKNIAYYFVSFCTLLVLNLFVKNRNDDLVFKAGIEQYGSLAGWVKWFGLNWGGRIIPQGLLVGILQLPDLVYASLTSFFMILLGSLALDTFGISAGNTRKMGLVLLFVLIHALLPFSMLNETLYWKCACVLYVWGFSTLLLSIRPMLAQLRGQDCSLLTYSVALPAIIYTASFEQAGVFMSGWMGLATIYYAVKNRALPNGKTLALLAIASAATYAFFTLPGNSNRMIEEIVAWYQSFGALSITDKILLGASTSITMLEQEVLPVVLLIIVMLIYLNDHSEDTACDTTTWQKSVLRVLLVYFLFCEISVIGHGISGDSNILTKVYTLYTPDTMQLTISPSRIICDTIHYMAYVLLGCCLSSVGSVYDQFVDFSMYFAGFCSMFIMGFSPTIYASSSRPRFMCYFILTCLMMRMFMLAHDDLHRKTL